MKEENLREAEPKIKLKRSESCLVLGEMTEIMRGRESILKRRRNSQGTREFGKAENTRLRGVLIR